MKNIWYTDSITQSPFALSESYTTDVMSGKGKHELISMQILQKYAQAAERKNVDLNRCF